MSAGPDTSVAVSVVVPVFNRWDMTRDCLGSLAAQLPGEGVEVVVVDNGSTDETPAACPALGRDLFPGRYRHLAQHGNQGFARACNAGAAAACGELLFFLNNDTLLANDPLPPLMEELGRPGVGCCSPLLLYPDRTIQHMGIGFLHAHKFVHLFRGFPGDHRVTRRAPPVRAVSAAALLVPAAVFRCLDGFHEGFMNGYEDLDLCRRMGRQGLGCAVRTDAWLYHLESQSAGRHDFEAANYETYSRRVGDGFEPDLDLVSAQYGLDLALNECLEPYFVPGSELNAAYVRQVEQAGLESAMDILAKDPCWEEGYYGLIAMLRDNGMDLEALGLAMEAARFCPSLKALDLAFRLAARVGDTAKAEALAVKRGLVRREAARPALQRNAEALLSWARKRGREQLAEALQGWLARRAA